MTPPSLVPVAQVLRLVWHAEHRDARSATARHALPPAVPLRLPTSTPRGLHLHELTARARDGWVLRHEQPTTSPTQALRMFGLTVTATDEELLLDAALLRATWPERRARRVLTLRPGETGRWQANLRSGHLCEGPPWYEQWSVNLAWVEPGRVTSDLFLGTPDRSRDELVSLYGSRTVRSGSDTRRGSRVGG